MSFSSQEKRNLQTKGSVICLGEVLIDQVVSATGGRQNFPGGAPANVATALARFGVPTKFIGGLGQDRLGQSVLTVLQQQSVGCQGIQRLPKPTRIVEVRCTEGGDRAFGGFIGGAADEFADAYLSAEALPVAELHHAQVLVMGTLGLAYPATRRAMMQAASLVRAGGGLIVIDVNWRPTFWPTPQKAIESIDPWLQQAHWLKLSVEDAEALWQTSELDLLAQRFAQAEGILLTDGERGCQYKIAGHRGQLPAFSVSSQDTTGAGDAFLAGVIYCLCQQKCRTPGPAEILPMLTMASAVGALTTLQPGAIAAQPSLEQVSTFLQERTGQPWEL